MDENDSHLHADYFADPLGKWVLIASTEQTFQNTARNLQKGLRGSLRVCGMASIVYRKSLGETRLNGKVNSGTTNYQNDNIMPRSGLGYQICCITIESL